MPARPTTVAAARRSATGLPYLVAAGLLWGTGGLTGTLLARVGGLSPLAVATYRLAVGGALIVAVLLATGRRVPRTRAAYARVGAVGGLAALYQACYFAAVALTSVSVATLITIGTSPVLVLAAEAATGRRRIDAGAVATVGLALAGLGLLVGLPSGGFGLPATLASAGLAVCSAAGFATMTLIGARPVPGLDELTTTGAGFAIGGALLAAVAAPTAGLAVHPTPAALGLLLALGAGPTALAYTLYFRGLRTAGPGTAAVLALLEPLTGALLAAVLLGDRLGPAGIAGALLLVGAVTRAALAGRRRQ